MALSASVVQRRQADGAAITVGFPAGSAIGSFSYDCGGSCQLMEPWVSLRFSQPVVIQCLRYEACTGTPATTSTTRATTTPAATTTTTGGTTLSNPFLGDEFQDFDFGDLGGLGRRLAAPDQVVLHRSADSITWSHVATWASPQPGAMVSLSSATYQPPYVALLPSWNPAPDGCSRCGLAGRGVGKQAQLEANFGRKVYLGTGKIEISRGGFTTLTMNAASSPWFQTSGDLLYITPQDALAPSGGCVRIKLLDQAIVDADGYPYEQDPFVPCSFESCVEDYQPPELRSSDPPNNAAGVELMPTLRLNFDEEVRLVDPTTAAATLSAKTVPAAGGSIPPTQIIDLNPAMLRVWDPNTGATVLDVTPLSELEAQTSYELEIRGDVIEDVSGNPWAGGSVVFNTQCSIYGCVDATTATTTQDFQAEDAGPSTAVYLIVVATLTILCAFGVGVFQMYLRKQLFGPSKSEVRPFKPEEQPNEGSPRNPVAAPRLQTSPPPPETGPEVHWNGPTGPLFEQGAGPKAASPERPQAHWRGKAREAEDIGGRGSRGTDFGRGPNQPYTDENATGRKERAPGGPSGFHSRERHRNSADRNSTGNAAPAKKEAEPPKPLSDNPEVAAILVELNAQLEKTHKEDIASRKKTFKFSCLRWHPDKNPDSAEVANEVFQWLQSQRDWYLKE